MRKLLIVVDMQKDFIDGSLGTKEAQAIVPAATARIRACRAAGYTVIATLDTHEENYMDTREGKHLPVPHCIWGTAGWRIRPEIMDALGDDAILVEKPTFGSMDLIKWLAGVDEVELVGLCTDICVISNALLIKAAYPETVVSVDSACCAGVTPESPDC